MHIITRKVTLIPAPFVGTRIKIALDDPESLTWGIFALTYAAGHTKAVIDWGDGGREEIDGTVQPIHNYARTGTYEVSISDDISDLRCSTKSASSEFRLRYAPMIHEVCINANTLSTVADCCFYNALNLKKIDCKGTGLRILGQLAFNSCVSMSGRFDFPGVDSIASTTFAGCSGITELHFSKVNEAAIKALPAWESSGHRFGAENATVSFDL